MEKVSQEMRDRISAFLERMAELGPDKFPKSRVHLIDADERLYQFRIDHLRVLWFYEPGRIVICCHAFEKRVNKTPKGAIDLARKAKQSYEIAKKSNACTYIEIAP